MPPISSSGMNTAISEQEIDTTVKPISREPLSGRGERRLAMLDVAIDVLHHDNGVIDHEADRDGERHQRQVVEAEMHQIHRRERAGERQRNGHAGNERRPEIAQEQKDHHHHEADGEDQRELDVGDRGADRHGAVEDGFDLHRRRNARGELRQFGLDLVDGVDDVGAGLLEYGQDDAVLVVLIAGDRAVDRLAIPPGRCRERGSARRCDRPARRR